MGKLHHAMREAKALRVALGPDEAGCGQRLQQAIERRTAEADAALDFQHAQRRLIRGKALQDGDGAIDGANRAALAFRLGVFLAHRVMLVLRQTAMSTAWTHISFWWTRLAN